MVDKYKGKHMNKKNLEMLEQDLYLHGLNDTHVEYIIDAIKDTAHAKWLWSNQEGYDGHF